MAEPISWPTRRAARPPSPGNAASSAGRTTDANVVVVPVGRSRTDHLVQPSRPGVEQRLGGAVAPARAAGPRAGGRAELIPGVSIVSGAGAAVAPRAVWDDFPQITANGTLAGASAAGANFTPMADSFTDVGGLQAIDAASDELRSAATALGEDQPSPPPLDPLGT